MKVLMQDALKDYLHDHHHTILSLRVVHDDYSVGNINTRHPVIRYKKPRHVEDFDEYHIDDFTIYIEKDIQALDDTIEFIDEKLFGIHGCHVRGLDLDYIKDIQ